MQLAGAKCLFVVSHPRSGTHLWIDFVRRNFPAFNPRLMFWESSSRLYLNIDRADWQREAYRLRSPEVSHILIKSHLAGFRDPLELRARKLLNPRREIFLYPFRKFSRMVKSYAEFRGYQGPVSSILGERDLYFGLEMTVAECIRAHAESWLERGAAFVDSDLLLTNPKNTCGRLAELLGEPAADLRQPLPCRKPFSGMLGELLTRIRRRQSTEVVVPYKLAWRDCDEELAVDAEFSELYGALSRRRIN